MRRPSTLPATPAARPLRTGLLLGLVGLNIGLQLINASLIKYASGFPRTKVALVALLLTLVAVLSFGRFIVWGALHKRFPVSVAYPATALFFPCLVGLAAAFGEPISIPQWLGASLVTFGVVLLLRPPHSDPAGSQS